MKVWAGAHIVFSGLCFLAAICIGCIGI
ncbi:hypothetical protein LINPERPRIM_LOCUS43361 [Linum perenne]